MNNEVLVLVEEAADPDSLDRSDLETNLREARDGAERAEDGSEEQKRYERNVKRYEAFLRPILRRLQKIDGRAPVSIMTNSVDPKDPQLQTWLKEGLSLETHTTDHPCPFFRGGSLAKALRRGVVAAGDFGVRDVVSLAREGIAESAARVEEVRTRST